MTRHLPGPAGLVGLVVVSHSRALARAAVALAQEMLHGRPVRIEVAAGLDDTTFGTDAGQILDAITEADRGAGVVVLMDLGSAVLSAELALELLDDAARERVLLCPAPLVEGLIVAAVAAAGGAGRDEVAAEAAAALAGKTSHLGVPATGAADGLGAVEPGELVGAFAVTNPHGLHARPASRVVQAVRMLDARVALRNRTTGSAWVPASSLSKVATLGALCGHEVEVRVSGNQAREALDHVVALAARAFDETPDPAAIIRNGRVAAGGEAGRPDQQAPIAASPGIGIGPAWSMHGAPLDVADARTDEPAAEWRRLKEAIAAVRRTVQRVRARAVREIGEADAAIFDAHLLLLDDADLLSDVRSRVDGGQAAAPAWSATLRRIGADLAALPDPYLQARASDVAAVGDQVLRALLGVSGRDLPPVGVLVAAELTPSEAAELDSSRVAAVVQAFGSPTAHSTILLRARGIPAVVAAGAGVLGIADGTLLAVDGTRGEVMADPPPDVQADFRARATELALRERRALTHAASPAVTRDGVGVLVGANVGSVEDARAAATCGADLAGLVRTEFLFLGRAQAPDVDEQEAVYRQIAGALGGRRITLRTLDVGGDKPLGYLPMPAEANPFLGVRGIRLAMVHPGLLADQLLAIVAGRARRAGERHVPDDQHAGRAAVGPPDARRRHQARRSGRAGRPRGGDHGRGAGRGPESEGIRAARGLLQHRHERPHPVRAGRRARQRRRRRRRRSVRPRRAAPHRRGVPIRRARRGLRRTGRRRASRGVAGRARGPRTQHGAAGSSDHQASRAAPGQPTRRSRLRRRARGGHRRCRTRPPRRAES